MLLSGQLGYCKEADAVVELDMENYLEDKHVTRSAREKLHEGDFVGFVTRRKKIIGELKGARTETLERERSHRQ